MTTSTDPLKIIYQDLPSSPCSNTVNTAHYIRFVARNLRGAVLTDGTGPGVGLEEDDTSQFPFDGVRQMRQRSYVN